MSVSAKGFSGITLTVENERTCVSVPKYIHDIPNTTRPFFNVPGGRAECRGRYYKERLKSFRSIENLSFPERTKDRDHEIWDGDGILELAGVPT